MITANQVSTYYSSYLNLSVGEQRHQTIVFFDTWLPDAFVQGLEMLDGTKISLVDSRQLPSQREYLEGIYRPSEIYLSIHDFCAHTVYPFKESAVKFAQRVQSLDYTSFEFPRYDLTNSQIELLLDRHTKGVPLRDLSRADAFFEKLGQSQDYQIVVLTGPKFACALNVKGGEPWMEVCGPLKEGDIRFGPGCEIFRSGKSVDGIFYCGEAINLLPFRSQHVETDLCRSFVEFGKLLPGDPVELEFRDSKLVEIRSLSGRSASVLRDTIKADVAFEHLCEVGIGVSDSCSPLIHDWAATSNETVPGVHIGIGADPGDARRFKTSVHVDLVSTHSKLFVNGALFLDQGRFAEV